MEKTEDKLNNSWFPGIINVFADKNSFVSPKAEKLDSFFDCVTTLISNQVKKQLFSIINEKVNDNFPCIKLFNHKKKLKRKGCSQNKILQASSCLLIHVIFYLSESFLHTSM